MATRTGTTVFTYTLIPISCSTCAYFLDTAWSTYTPSITRYCGRSTVTCNSLVICFSTTDTAETGNTSRIYIR